MRGKRRKAREVSEARGGFKKRGDGVQLGLPSGAREVCEHALIFGHFIEDGLITSQQFIEINAFTEVLSIQFRH